MLRVPMDRRRPTLIDQILQAKGTLEKLLTLLQSRTICFSPLSVSKGGPANFETAGKGGKQIERCVISTFRIAESLGFKGEFRQWEALTASWRLEFRHPLTSDVAAPICALFASRAAGKSRRMCNRWRNLPLKPMALGDPEARDRFSLIINT